MRRTKLSVSIEVHEKIISLLRDGVAINRVAKQVGVANRTVERRAKEIREPAEEVEFRRRHWRCPMHGSVNVWPCAICEAMKARKDQRGMDTA